MLLLFVLSQLRKIKESTQLVFFFPEPFARENHVYFVRQPSLSPPQTLAYLISCCFETSLITFVCISDLLLPPLQWTLPLIAAESRWISGSCSLRGPTGG